jgi:hypothetical protein
MNSGCFNLVKAVPPRSNLKSVFIKEYERVYPGSGWQAEAIADDLTDAELTTRISNLKKKPDGRRPKWNPSEQEAYT